MKKIHLYLVIGLSFILTACNPSGEEGLQKILSSSQVPTGVVFEVASGDEEGMKWVIPMVKSYSRQLREKFPGIKLALVSHGEEQFQFTRSNIQRFANAHKQVKRLVNDEAFSFMYVVTMLPVQVLMQKTLLTLLT